MENRIILVRSQRELLEKGYVGYGWNNVNFKSSTTLKDLLENAFNGIKIGRRKKQIIRFFSLKKGDIVIVPVSGAIAVGIVEGTKEYEQNSNISLSANRVKVNFFNDENQKIIYVPRVQLATNLERRLKIRMSIADLEGFRTEIENIVSKLKNNEIYTWDSEIQQKEEEATNTFIEKLEERLRTEKGLGLAAGGYGLELLIKEIFEAKGYEAEIPSKNSRPVGEDIDIIATKEGELGSKGEKYLIQAKHHRGTTNRHGLNQLIACKDDENDDEYFYRKILITTAKVDESLKLEAKEDHGIVIIVGEELAKWIFENLSILSQTTLRKLGISEVPSLI